MKAELLNQDDSSATLRLTTEKPEEREFLEDLFVKRLAGPLFGDTTTGVWVANLRISKL
jgi:hypothetical protein